MTTDGVYKVVQYYARKVGIGDIERLGVHAPRATAATNALDHQADIAKVQEWLGHANIADVYLQPPSDPVFGLIAEICTRFLHPLTPGLCGPNLRVRILSVVVSPDLMHRRR